MASVWGDSWDSSWGLSWEAAVPVIEPVDVTGFGGRFSIPVKPMRRYDTERRMDSATRRQREEDEIVAIISVVTRCF